MELSTMETESYQKVTRCRICNSRGLNRYLNLGLLPLVNSYATDDSQRDEKYPLEILYCRNCSLSQLSIVVAPEKLYRQYAYRSSISETFKKHCELFAEDVSHKYHLTPNDLTVDIASNDGCLIREFKKYSANILGIDPAENLVHIANQMELRSIARFWNLATAKEVEKTYGKAKVITATNVFAHVHDIHGFLKAVDIFLKEDGIFIIEVPYLVNFINKKEFDTTYHEHLSYFLIKPIVHLLAEHSLELFDVQQFMIHGGTVRLHIKRTANRSITGERPESIQWLMDLENDLGLHDFKKYREFSSDVENVKKSFMDTLKGLKEKNKKIAAYGASAKGNVLLNFCGIGRDVINYIIDDTPEKIGKFTPGNHIPIVRYDMLHKERPDYLVLLAWNFADELMRKTASYKSSGGRYIIPIPTVRVV
jgi:hypothetical protein